MAEPAIRELMSEVENLSSTLADVSTKISNHIRTFENHLNRLDGKVETMVRSKEIGDLVFRRQRSRWCLYFAPKDNPEYTRIVECTVERKAEAVLLFEMLVRQMGRNQSRKIAVLASALATVEGVIADLGITDEEGS